MNFQSFFQRLRERLKGTEYRKPILEPLELPKHELSPIEAWNQVSSLSADVQAALREAKQEATNVLEMLVRRSETERRRMETIFDNLNDAILLTSRTGEIVAANRTARQAFLIPTNEFIGQPVHALFPNLCGETALMQESASYFDYLKSLGCEVDCSGCAQRCSVEELQKMYMDYVRTKPTLLNRALFFDYLRRDGALLSIRAMVNVLTLDPMADDFNFIVVFQDQTENKQTEEEVAHLRTLTSTLMSVAPIPVFYKDTDLKFTSVNKPFLDLLKLADGEVIGKTASQVFSPETAAKMTLFEEGVLASDQMLHTTLDLQTKDGIHRAKVLGRAMRDGEDLTGLTGSIIVTFNLDSNLREAVFVAVSKAIVFLDKDMKVTGCNDEFLRLLNAHKNDLIGKGVEDNRLAALIRPEQTGMLSDSVDWKDKKISRLCIPMMDSSGNQQGMVYVFFVQIDN